jgi:hypothetical protein
VGLRFEVWSLSFVGSYRLKAVILPVTASQQGKMALFEPLTFNEPQTSDFKPQTFIIFAATL